MPSGRPRILSALSLVLLAACGSRESAPKSSIDEPIAEPGPAPARLPTDSDFEMVCEGVGVESAAPYAKQPGKASPTLIFVREGERHERDFNPAYGPWDVDDYADTQLVACLSVETTKVKKCPSVDKYDATYTISVREAKTAKVLAKVEAEVPVDRECEMPGFVEPEAERESQRGSYDAPLLTVLADLQPPDAPGLELSEDMVALACEGRALPGASTLDPAKGASQAVALYRRHEGGVWESDYDGWFAAEDWKVSAMSFGDTALVVCTETTEGDKIRTCEFDDGELDIHRGDYAVKLRSATTGEVVAERTFASTEESDCPALWSFAEATQDRTLAEPEESVVDWLRPFVEPRVEG